MCGIVVIKSIVLNIYAVLQYVCFIQEVHVEFHSIEWCYNEVRHLQDFRQDKVANEISPNAFGTHICNILIICQSIVAQVSND